MKSKKLVSTVLAVSIIGGGLLMPNSPIYSIINRKTECNTVQAKNAGKYINIEKRYNAKEVPDNPTVEQMLKVSKPCPKNAIIYDKDDGEPLAISPSNLPHDNNFYYITSKWEGRTYHTFMKSLCYKVSSNVRYQTFMDRYMVDYCNGEIKQNKSKCVPVDNDLKAREELLKLYDWNTPLSYLWDDATDPRKDYPDYAPGVSQPDNQYDTASTVKPKPVVPGEDKPTGNTDGTKQFVRLSGSSRYDTNLELVRKWEKSDTIVICNGQNFPDALSAAPLATKYKAPIMLTNGKLTEKQLGEVHRLGVKRVYCVGGEAVVPKAVENQVKAVGVSSIKRLAGNDRFDTCTEVAKEVGFKNGYVVVNGDNFPDALSIAPVAASKGMPIILSHSTDLEPKMKGLLNGKPKTGNYIAGGSAVISDKIQKQTGGTRLGGKDRYDTNYEIIKHFAKDSQFANVYIANGDNFPDALSATALAGKNNAPLVLVNPSTVKDKTAKLMKDNNYKKATFIGGEAVTPSHLISKLK